MDANTRAWFDETLANGACVIHPGHQAYSPMLEHNGAGAGVQQWKVRCNGMAAITCSDD